MQNLQVLCSYVDLFLIKDAKKSSFQTKDSSQILGGGPSTPLPASKCYKFAFEVGAHAKFTWIMIICGNK